jgi:hypothetical protein
LKIPEKAKIFDEEISTRVTYIYSVGLYTGYGMIG